MPFAAMGALVYFPSSIALGIGFSFVGPFSLTIPKLLIFLLGFLRTFFILVLMDSAWFGWHTYLPSGVVRHVVLGMYNRVINSIYCFLRQKLLRMADKTLPRCMCWFPV